MDKHSIWTTRLEAPPAMAEKPPRAVARQRIGSARRQLRTLGWLTLAAFTCKGVVTTSLIVWALLNATR
jgi:hypothetical protein